MKSLLFGVAVLMACDGPTAMKQLTDPTDEARVVRPSEVRVTVTPANASAYPGDAIQYVATARDGNGRLLRPSAWTWNSSDTTIAVVSPTGLATGRALGQGVITATAYPPFRK
jgi:uncharacterized protein YjdB